jgi:hypothetical protein
MCVQLKTTLKAPQLYKIKKMKKIIPVMLLAGMFTVFLTRCKKTSDEVQVYRPATPAITFSDVSDLIIDSTGKTITLKAKITAAAGLDKVEVLYQPWNIAKTISSFSNTGVYELSEPVVIPAGAALQLHAVTIKATDKKGATNFTEVKVGLQDLNYAKLYMADVEDDAALTSDLFGVPVVMDKTGSHTYQLTYYARNSNVKIRFLPGKTSFTPVAIGLDPANNQKLVTDAARSLPIVLPNKGYYKITVNTLLLTYAVETAAATGTAVNQVAIAGRGFTDFPTMNYQNTLPNIILMDKDAANPFLFTKVVKMGIPAGQTYTTTQFILTTNNGWTNFWRFDNSASPEKAVFNGGSDAIFPSTSTPVTYLLIFDSFTQRVQALKQ